MIHEIKNQLGNHIEDTDIRDEIIHATEHGLTHTYFDGKRIDIKDHKKNSKEMKTLVYIEGI